MATAVKPPATDPDYQARKPSVEAPLRSAYPAAAATAAEEPAGPAGAAAFAPSAVGGAGTGAAVATRGSRRVSVILHGKRADEADVRAAVKALRAEGVRVDVKVTWESGDVSKFVKDIVRERSADTIVAAGGDGTLNEVVAALIKVKAPRSIAVGLMPMGTSNDFAAVTSLPTDLEGALRLCCRSDNLHFIDVGLLNGEVFMNTATLGASSELGSETSHEAKQLLGPAAYLVKGFARLAGYAAVPVRMRFPTPSPDPVPGGGPSATASRTNSASLPGSSGIGAAVAAAAATTAAAADTPAGKGEEKQAQQQQQQVSAQVSAPAAGKKEAKVPKKGKTMELTEQVLNLTAGNSRQLASMVQACPDALLDDGLLDITYVTGGAAEGATSLMGEILSRGLDEAQPNNVRMMRVPWIELEVQSEDPAYTWPGNRDGEPVPPGRKFLLEALPRRVAMHLPPECEALAARADPRVNAPVASLNRLRKGAFKAMLAQVTRFKRINPFLRPWWQGAMLGLLSRAPSLLLSFGAGYLVASRRLGGGGGGGGGSGAEQKEKEKKEEKEKEKQVAKERGKGRLRALRVPSWPRGQQAQTGAATAVPV